MVVWSALSLLPDADVVAFRFGIAYADPWGHRGATHSLVFALLLGCAIGAASKLVRLPPVRTGLCATVVLASHGLLDTLTDGGLGCALFWPFDDARFFAPWSPIPVAPIGRGLLSGYGRHVVLVELAMF
jgi:inner membrane protein